MTNINASNGSSNKNKMPPRTTPRYDYASWTAVPDSVEEAEREYLEYERAVRKMNANKLIWDLSDTSFADKANVARAWKEFQEWNLTDDGTPYYEKSKLWEIFANHTVFEDLGFPKPVLAEMELGTSAPPQAFVEHLEKEIHVHNEAPRTPSTNGAVTGADHDSRE